MTFPEQISRLSARLDGWLSRMTDASVRDRIGAMASSPSKSTLLLIGLCAVLYLPGMAGIPPLDRDEPRYAQATKQMIETGDYTRIYFQDSFRNKKPVGIYWLQAASVKLMGGQAVKDSIWPYRLPGMLCTMGTVLLVFRLGTLLAGRAQGLLAALLVAVTPLLVAVSHAATTDAALLFFTTLAQFNLVRIYLANRQGDKPEWINALLFWSALGCGILIKGPITPLVSLLTAVSLMICDRNRRALRGIRPGIGIPLMLAIVLPWLISIQIATDGAFLRDSLGHDFGRKLASGQESHGAPPGLYTLLMAVTCWPASLVAVPALVHAWRHRRKDILSAVAFCWVVPYLVVIELVPTKLPHYVLPAYPAVVLLCARFAWYGTPQELPNRLWKGLHWLYRRVWVIVFPLATLAVFATAVLSRLPLLSILVGIVLAIAAVAIIRLSEKSPLCRLAGSLPLLALASLLLFGMIMPQLRTLWVSRTAAQVFGAIQAVQPDARLYAVGYHEPSLVFLAGTETALCNTDTIDAQYSTNMVAFLDDSALDRVRHPLVKAATVKGINYSKGKLVRAGIYLHPDSPARGTVCQPEE
jgi:4-amino-4-deoxy-L-arabinose transferase-like glycosyltransferase